MAICPSFDGHECGLACGRQEQNRLNAVCHDLLESAAQ